MSEDKRARITVFSDYVCPFCYLEEPDLARVRERYGDEVEVDWRAYELRPHPIPTLDPDGEYLHSVWNASVYPMSRILGMTLFLPSVQPRSRKAHEAAEHACEEGRFEEMHTALFKAFFEEGKDIGEEEVLLEVGSTAGLDRNELQVALREDRYARKVLSDEELSRRLGVASVPTMFVGLAGEPLEEVEAILGAQHSGGRLESAVERALSRAPRGSRR